MQDVHLPAAELQLVSLNQDAAVVIEVSIGHRHSFQRSRLITTATGVARAPAVTNDVVVRGSIDGVLYFGLAAAGAELTIQMDGPTPGDEIPQTTIDGQPIGFLQFTANASILTTETATIAMVSTPAG